MKARVNKRAQREASRTVDHIDRAESDRAGRNEQVASTVSAFIVAISLHTHPSLPSICLERNQFQRLHPFFLPCHKEGFAITSARKSQKDGQSAQDNRLFTIMYSMINAAGQLVSGISFQ